VSTAHRAKQQYTHCERQRARDHPANAEFQGRAEDRPAGDEVVAAVHHHTQPPRASAPDRDAAGQAEQGGDQGVHRMQVVEAEQDGGSENGRGWAEARQKRV